jgi:uncharacterized membrane protein
MKRVLAVCVLGLVAALGCNQSEPGGPGAHTTGNKNPLTGAPKHETFKIDAPAMATTVKQGDQKEVSVTVDRSKDFKEDVTLTFAADKGVHVSPASHTVKASDSDTKVKVMVEADKTAPIGEAKVHVTATPQTGEATSVDFKVNVKGS